MAKPQIFDRNMKRLAYLDNALAVGYSLELNSLWTATFTLPANDPKNQYCTALNYVEIFDGNERVDLFRIIGEDLERADGVTRFYNCEHVLATLLSDVLFKYHQYGGSGVKTADVLNYILARQTRKNWKLGECAFTRYFEYNWENSTLLAALFAVPECFDGEYVWEWDTTVYPWTISLVAPSDTLKSEIRYAKNMTTIKKTTDATSIANRVYALGYGEGVNQLTIESVNGGFPYVEDAVSIEAYGLCSTILVDTRYEIAENLKAYAEQVLAELKDPYVSYEIGAIDLYRLAGDRFSKFRPGEIVRVVDTEDGINLRTRIVRVEKSDAESDPGSVSVTIANKSQDIVGSISDLQSRALIGETYAQGATNQQIYNFSDNADPTHSATLKLYISSDVVRINKMLLNIQFEPFRAFEKAVGGGGGQTTSSGGGQTTSSGGGSTTSSGGGQTTSDGGGQTTSSGGGSTTSSGGGSTTSSGGGSTTSSGGGSTTSSGGGSTTSSGGGQTSGGTALESSNILPSETTGQAVHNHGLSKNAKLAIVEVIDGECKVVGYETWIWSGAHTHPEHTHTIRPHTHTVDDHTHWVSAHTHTVSNHTHTVSNHTHRVSAHTHTVSAHTHTVSAHTHEVRAHTHTVSAHTHTVNDHTHALEFGIYEGQCASRATIKVDGKQIPTPAEYSNINIVDYLSKDKSGKIARNAWHTIEILPNTMSRIVGAVFSQTFCNSRGGGDY